MLPDQNTELNDLRKIICLKKKNRKEFQFIKSIKFGGAWQTLPCSTKFSVTLYRLQCFCTNDVIDLLGWSGGATVLDKLPVPGRPTYLNYSRTSVYCACSTCGWQLFRHFSLVCLFYFFPPSLGDGLIWTEILSQRAFKPKTTNQPTNHRSVTIATTELSNVLLSP